jgi:glucan 1,3-beta-glucosidase
MNRPVATERASAVPWLLAGAALLLLGSWWLAGRPVDLPAAGHMPLQCVSYAPSTKARAQPGPVTREHLRRDLEQIAEQFRCVRTYTVSDGLDQVPSIARELGLRVLLGAWIGSDPAHNEREIATAIEVARREHDTIEAIVVGNEVLLRHEMSEEQLAPLIERVGRDTGLAVTYADVWEFWMSHKALAQSVSFVTVHILPYWDDHPVGIDELMPYVERLYLDVCDQFPGKRVLVGETGWPSDGRPRGGLEPGSVNQARYLREFTALAERRGIPYNLIEAYDQPWKRGFEGTVGGHWGINDAEGHPKFSWSGPVAEAPQGRLVSIAAFILGVIGAVAGWLLGGTHKARAAATLASGAILAVAIGAHQFDDLRAGNQAWIDWAATLLVAVAGWLVFLAAVRGTIAAGPARDPVPRALVLAVLLGCAYACVGLVFAGRYRDFPVWLFLPAVFGMTIAAWIDPASRRSMLLRHRATEETLLAMWIVLAGAAIPVIEGPGNRLAIAWGASAALLGLSVLLPLAGQARENQHTAHHASH